MTVNGVVVTAFVISTLVLPRVEQTATPSSQSPAIEALIAEIQGKQPEQVRALIVARFGPPARDLGSGLRIDQWDVDGGVLTFNPVDGVTFEQRGERTRLIRTTNRAASCLFGNYCKATFGRGIPSGGVAPPSK